jgi:exosome complex RNA-binding protein Rrp42 (RNase PH superfamily)
MEDRLAERIARVSCSSNKEFVLEALAQGIRADGRGCDDCRACVISPASHGAGCQVEVQCGRTRVLAAVTSCIVEPYPDKPNKGIVTFSVKLDRCVASRFGVVLRRAFARASAHFRSSVLYLS